MFEALSAAQRRVAVVRGTPGEHEPSIRFRPAGQAHPETNYLGIEIVPTRRVAASQYQSSPR